MTKYHSALTTVNFVRVVLAVRLTITKHRDRDALFSVLACKLAWLTALHRHFPTTRGRCGHTAGGHQLIYKSRRRAFENWEFRFLSCYMIQMWCTAAFSSIPHLLCSRWSPHAGRRCVWTPQGWCAGSELWPADRASGSQGSCLPSGPQTPTTQPTGHFHINTSHDKSNVLGFYLSLPHMNTFIKHFIIWRYM